MEKVAAFRRIKYGSDKQNSAGSGVHWQSLHSVESSMEVIINNNQKIDKDGVAAFRRIKYGSDTIQKRRSYYDKDVAAFRRIKYGSD